MSAEAVKRGFDLSLNDRSMTDSYRLDKVDEAILWELQRDAQITNAALAERVHVSPSTTINRVRALKQSGIIRSAHVQLDFKALGFPVMAIVAVRLKMQARAELKTFAQRAILLPPVINLFFLGGPDDFLIHLAATSTDQLRDFVAADLSMDPVVAFTQTYIVFDHLVGNQYMDHVSGFEEIRHR